MPAAIEEMGIKTNCNNQLNNSEKIKNIISEMIETIENDARLNQKILLQVDSINLYLSEKDRLCWDLSHAATKSAPEYEFAKRTWNSFRARVYQMLDDLKNSIQQTRYPDAWTETYLLVKRRAALLDDLVNLIDTDANSEVYIMLRG